MKIPAVLVAGDSANWTDTAFADSANSPVDSGTYTLTYSFRGSIAAGNVDIVGVATGTGWKTSLTTAQSAAMNNTASALTVYWQAVATKSGVRVTAGTGTLLLKPNVAGLSTGATFDGRTQTELDLAAIKAEMSSRISGGATVEYTIGTRSLKKEPMAALIAMEQRLMRIIAREKRAAAAANGLGYTGRLAVRFK